MRCWTVAGTVVTILTAPTLHPPESSVEARPNTQPHPRPRSLRDCVGSLHDLIQSINVLFSVVDDFVVSETSVISLFCDVRSLINFLQPGIVLLSIVEDVVVAGPSLLSSYCDVSTGSEGFLRSTAQSSLPSGTTNTPVVSAGPGPLGSHYNIMNNIQGVPKKSVK